MLGTLEGLALVGTGVVIGVFLADYEILTATHVRRAARFSVERTRAYLQGTDIELTTKQTAPSAQPAKPSGPIGLTSIGPFDSKTCV